MWWLGWSLGLPVSLSVTVTSSFFAWKRGFTVLGLFLLWSPSLSVPISVSTFKETDWRRHETITPAAPFMPLIIPFFFRLHSEVQQWPAGTDFVEIWTIFGWIKWLFCGEIQRRMSLGQFKKRLLVRSRGWHLQAEKKWKIEGGPPTAEQCWSSISTAETFVQHSHFYTFMLHRTSVRLVSTIRLIPFLRSADHPDSTRSNPEF